MTSCKTVSEHFVCGVDTVWDVLTSPSSYKEWFGWPETLELLEVEPGFQQGGKLTFRNSNSTLVISELVPRQKLVLTGGYRTNEITLRSSGEGCRVSMVTMLNGVPMNNTGAAQETVNRNILKNLRRSCYARLKQTGDRQATIHGGGLSEQIFLMARGYRPVHRSRQDGADIPGTEQDLFIPFRSGVIGTLLAALLTLVLSITLTFERSDVVPSSGLSFAESELITSENAQSIFIGQSKHDLEVMLSCVGVQLSPDEYSYQSTEKLAGGESARIIQVVYDAYGRVRRYGYLDRTLAAQAGVPLRSVSALLSPSMQVWEVSEALQLSPSAFWVDKSGKTYLYFGRFLPGATLFDVNRTAELVISLDSANILTRVGYYLAENPENPLHTDELGGRAKRQYFALSQYRNDLAFYQRLFLLAGRTRSEVEAVLGMAALEEEQPLRSGGSRVRYTAGQLEESWRYRFTVEYSADGTALTVSTENAHLAGRSDMLGDLPQLTPGDSLFELYGALQILPSYAELDADGSLRLCFGERLRSSGSLARCWELVLWLDSSGTLQRYTTA